MPLPHGSPPLRGANHAPLEALGFGSEVPVEDETLAFIEADGTKVAVEHPEVRRRVVDRGGEQRVSDAASVHLGPHVQSHHLESGQPGFGLISPLAGADETDEPPLARFCFRDPLVAEVAAEELAPSEHPICPVRPALRKQPSRHKRRVRLIPHIEMKVSQGLRITRSSSAYEHLPDPKCSRRQMGTGFAFRNPHRGCLAYRRLISSRSPSKAMRSSSVPRCSRANHAAYWLISSSRHSRSNISTIRGSASTLAPAWMRTRRSSSGGASLSDSQSM